MIISKCLHWDETCPIYGQFPIAIQHMSFLLSVGSNVVLDCNPPTDTQLIEEFRIKDGNCVATILSYESANQIECLLYQPTQKLKYVPGVLDLLLSGPFVTV